MDLSQKRWKMLHKAHSLIISAENEALYESFHNFLGFNRMILYFES